MERIADPRPVPAYRLRVISTGSVGLIWRDQDEELHLFSINITYHQLARRSIWLENWQSLRPIKKVLKHSVGFFGQLVQCILHLKFATCHAPYKLQQIYKHAIRRCERCHFSLVFSTWLWRANLDSTVGAGCSSTRPATCLSSVQLPGVLSRFFHYE